MSAWIVLCGFMPVWQGESLSQGVAARQHREEPVAGDRHALERMAGPGQAGDADVGAEDRAAEQARPLVAQ